MMIRRAACVCIVVAGCARAEREVEFVPQAIKTWPAKCAERVLRVETEQYAIYARESDNAESLHTWLGDELAEAQARYGTAIGRGLVLAIESLEEPVAELDAWRAQNVDRYREIYWVDPFTRSDFHGFGRPYCWSGLLGEEPFWYKTARSGCRAFRINSRARVYPWSR